METNQQSSIFQYILIISLCIVFLMYLRRRMSSTGESIQDRIWRKIVFAYQDMLHTFDQAEKELLKHTYHNTIFNSKGVNVSNDTVINLNIYNLFIDIIQYPLEIIVHAKKARRKAPMYNSI